MHEPAFQEVIEPPAVDRTPPSTGEGASQGLNRRRFIVGAGMVAATAAVLHANRPAPVAAQEQPPAMRSAQRLSAAATGGGPPALPPLAVIALNRMGFGPRPGDIESFHALSSTEEAAFEAYVEQQLNPAAIDDSICDAEIASGQYKSLNKSLTQLWIDYVENQLEPKNDRYQPFKDVDKVTFLRAVYSKRQLIEVLADHWHNHFNVFGEDYWAAPTWVHYDRDVIRGNMLGNFRQMLEAVAQSPAMLYYLDNQSNSGGNPNENYARELFELHALGAENYMGVKPLEVGPNGNFIHPAPKDETGRPLLYIDEDVYGATTCFTGWRVDGDTGLFKFDASAHFPYQKVVLGRSIPAAQGIKDGRDVLDLLARHPGTARYISRKLCRRLIGDFPPESVVQAAADVFLVHVDAPDQLKQVVRTILLSPEFRTTWGEKIKRPFEYVVSVLRASEADFAANDGGFGWMYSSMGQPLFRWRPPNGYPDFRDAWSSTMPMLQRWRMVNWLIEWRYGGEGSNKDVPRLLFNHPPNLKTPILIVDYWSLRLLGQFLPDSERTSIINFMAFGRSPESDLPAKQIEDRLRYMIALIFLSPSFQYR